LDLDFVHEPMDGSEPGADAALARILGKQLPAAAVSVTAGEVGVADPGPMSRQITTNSRSRPWAT
jgi:hypothetical protein